MNSEIKNFIAEATEKLFEVHSIKGTRMEKIEALEKEIGILSDYEILQLLRDFNFELKPQGYAFELNSLPILYERLTRKKPRKNLDARKKSMHKMIEDVIVDICHKQTEASTVKRLEEFKTGSVRPLIRKGISFEFKYSGLVKDFDNMIMGEVKRRKGWV